jgi:uncharacterized SAM-binding protein YcdF (DUF218 family)
MQAFRRIRRLAVIGLAAVGLLAVVVHFTPLVYWWARALAGPWNDPRGEIVIVPAADSMGSGIMGSGTYLRCMYAALIWREGGVHRIVVTGGGGPAEPIAVTMQKLLISYGIPPEAVIVETISTSTRLNAVYTAGIVESLPGRKVLLTSDYHMFRAVRAFRKAGAQVEPRPFPDVLKRANTMRLRWPVFVDLIDETCKIAYYKARGWI